jgi:hypothetical protein
MWTVLFAFAIAAFVSLSGAAIILERKQDKRSEVPG